jgi:hypothetical protein
VNDITRDDNRDTDTLQPDPQIDVRNNPESRAAEADAHTSVARASGGGGPPPDGGTASGSPVDGVTISDGDLEEAVSGDTGPTGDEGPRAGHA